MHVRFASISYKNILSVGDVPVEIDFLQSKNTLISAPNGAGKSTAIEAIIFALYGKPFRKITKGQLINSINKKQLLVEVRFTVGDDSYLVRRGIKPNVFEVFKNDTLLNKDAAARDYQEHLETNILKMSYKSFTQIVILGSATYVPFMELPAAQRRDIIEDLLDIQIFSTMNVLLKEKVSSNKQAISDNNNSLAILDSKIQQAEQHKRDIQKIQQDHADKLKARAVDLLKQIEQRMSTIEEIEQQITSLGATITDKQKQKQIQSQLKDLIRDLNTKKTTIGSEVSFYSSHDDCPTCRQDIDNEFKRRAIQEKNIKHDEIVTALTTLEKKLSKADVRLEAISDVEDQMQKLHNKANESRLTVKMIKSQLADIKQELLSAEKQVKEIDDSALKQHVASRNEIREQQAVLHNEREMLAVVTSMLKDGGIKTSVIKTYVPIMNKVINQYLAEFELFVDFNLDENFNETIKSRFRDAFSFTSFSEGEKMRINLSIMFAWRALAKLRNSVSTNLLFLDETLDGAADSTGVESLIDILKKLNSNDNVFVISHRGEQFAEKFDNHIQFAKVKNFTQVVQ